MSWSGQDDADGSGIAAYDIYVSDNGGPFNPFLLNTTDVTATFTGAAGHTYGFYSVATDNVGHVEAPPLAPDATIQVLGASATTTLQPSQESPAYGDSLTFTANVWPDPSRSRWRPPAPCSS